jgi:hypothetical protein
MARILLPYRPSRSFARSGDPRTGPQPLGTAHGEPIATGSCVMSQKMCAASGIGRYEGAVRSKVLSHCGSTAANPASDALID